MGIKISIHAQVFTEMYDAERIKDIERHTTLQYKQERMTHREEKLYYIKNQI